MPRYKIVSEAGVEMGVFEGKAPIHAIAAMYVDAGYEARVERFELITTAPGEWHTLRVVEVD